MDIFELIENDYNNIHNTNYKHKRLIFYCKNCGHMQNSFGHESVKQTDDGVHVVMKSLEILYRDCVMREGDDFYFLQLEGCVYCDDRK